MALDLPSAARDSNELRRREAGRVKIRRQQWDRPKVGGRKPYAKGNPSKWKWGEVPTNAPQGSFGRLKIEGHYSKHRRVVNNVPNVDPDKLRRWWQIKNGVLPEDERTDYPIPTDDEMAEKADEELRELKAIVDARVEDLRNESEARIKQLYDRAAEYEADDNRETRRASIRESEKLYSEALEEQAECQSLVEREGETFKEQREEVKARLQKEQEDAMEKAAERVEELKNNLDKEIQAAANVYFEDDGAFTLDSFELFE